MTPVVESLFRYPVKSMQGLAVPSLDIGRDRIRGDRARALVDVETGRLLSAKRFSRLLLAAADDEAVTLPDGRRVPYTDPDSDRVLSDWIGREVQLREPSGPIGYEMTFEPPNDEAEYVEIPSPAGTFLDLAAVHLVSDATLAGCAARHPELDWDHRRFRPNIVVAGLDDRFAEDAWCGQEMRVGTAVLRGRQPTVRCAMPLRAQPGLARQPALFDALDHLHDNHLGVYLDVASPGTIGIGDPIKAPLT